MRLGGPLFESYTDPDSWVTELKQLNYRASYCPEIPSGYTPVDFARAAQEADIVIAEVGVWNNPLSLDDDIREQAITGCQEKLALAENIGAACCVNIAGSRGTKWDGPHSDDLTPDTFAQIVETVRTIIDAVKPKRTFYTLETMPWMYPDSLDSYLRLIAAIDRPAFAVHFDPVNLISSPQRYFSNRSMISEFIAALGMRIKSVHAKDIVLRDHLTTHLDEVRPGKGKLDYPTLLKELNRLSPDLPVMVEHLPTPNEYNMAVAYIRRVAEDIGIQL